MKKTVSQARAGEPRTLVTVEDPSRPTLWASLIFAAATMLLAWPGLLGQTLFNSRSDQYTLGYA